MRLDPNNCFARMKLAVVHSRGGQLQQALTELEVVRQMQMLHFITQMQMLHFITQFHFQVVRQLQPKSMETLFALGKLLFRMGNTSLALVR